MAYLNSSKVLPLLSVTADTTITIPAGMSIGQIVIQNNTANAITGGLRVGVTNGGSEVVSGLAVGASVLLVMTDATILSKIFSMTVDTILYIQAVVAWNSADLAIRFVLNRVV